MKYLLLTLLLTGCGGLSPQHIPAADNYRFLVKEYETLNPKIEFTLLKNEEERKEVLKKVFGGEWKKVAGFTYWNEGERTCRIYIKDPMWSYEPEIIGHEVAHCIWGRFHKGLKGQGPIVNTWGKE